MTLKSNTADTLKEVGIRHFALFGYHGASLNAIAEDANIRKPSIYAHYQNKEALFYTCMEQASEDSFAHFKALVQRTADVSAENALYQFLNLYDYLCNNPDSQDYSMIFHTRFAYFPPEEVRDKVINHSNYCIKVTGEILNPVINRWVSENKLDGYDAEEVQTAFICLYDGLMVERLLGDKEKFLYRLKHAWSFFTSVTI